MGESMTSAQTQIHAQDRAVSNAIPKSLGCPPRRFPLAPQRAKDPPRHPNYVVMLDRPVRRIQVAWRKKFLNFAQSIGIWPRTGGGAGRLGGEPAIPRQDHDGLLLLWPPPPVLTAWRRSSSRFSKRRARARRDEIVAIDPFSFRCPLPRAPNSFPSLLGARPCRPSTSRRGRETGRLRAAVGLFGHEAPSAGADGEDKREPRGRAPARLVVALLHSGGASRESGGSSAPSSYARGGCEVASLACLFGLWRTRPRPDRQEGHAAGQDGTGRRQGPGTGHPQGLRSGPLSPTHPRSTTNGFP